MIFGEMELLVLRDHLYMVETHEEFRLKCGRNSSFLVAEDLNSCQWETAVN